MPDICVECGYDWAEIPRSGIPSAITSLVRHYRSRLLAHPRRALQAHPLPDVWSALEYACHVRDVLGVQRDRVALAIREDQPTFTPMGRDERVTELRYNADDPGDVAMAIDQAAARLADAFEALDDDGWERTGIYNWPTRQLRTVEWIARNTIHEGRHHLMDMDRLLPEGDQGSS